MSRVGLFFYSLVVLVVMVGISFNFYNSFDFSQNTINPINYDSIARFNLVLSGLSASWDFNEGTGFTTADSSGNNHNGNLVNGATWVVGHDGSAIQFDGANDVVTTDTSDYNITSSFTVALWVKRNNNVNGYGTLISRGNYIYPFNIRLEGPGRVETAVRTSSGVNYLATSAVLQQGQWYHVVLTYANGNRTVYLNGTPVISNILTGSISVPIGEQTTIGNIPSTDLGFNGTIDDVVIYNRALNVSEIQNIYLGVPADSTPPSVPQNLIGIGLGDSIIRLTWNASIDNESGISNYKIYRNNNLISQPVSTSYNDTSLNASTLYTYSVSAVNGAGLESNKSSIVNVSTLNDTTAPLISNVQSITTNISATITWTSNELSDSIVQYGLFNYTINVSNLTLTLQHSVRLNNLIPNTLYHFRVGSKDAFNNAVFSSDFNFTTIQTTSSSGIIYVGGYEADTQFDSIPLECLNNLKTKKYLLTGRSYTQNMMNGLNYYYYVNSSYALQIGEYDTNNGQIIPNNAFQSVNIVHDLCSLFLPTSRVQQFDSFVRNQFSSVLDFGMVEMHHFPDSSNYYNIYQNYTATFDKLRQDYPNIKIAYYTSTPSADLSNVADPIDSNLSMTIHDLVINNYYGEVPIYDYYDIVTTRNATPGGQLCIRDNNGNYNYPDCICTFQSGSNTFRRTCPEYILNNHPRQPIIEQRLGRSLFVLFSKTMCETAAVCQSNSSCDDGLFCNGAESCISGQCVSGNPPCASDGFTCTLDCSESTQSCGTIPQNNLCSDSNSCTDDLCVGQGGQAGTGCIFNNDDNNTCSVGGQCGQNPVCSSGQCVATPVVSLCSNPLFCPSVSCSSSSYMCLYSNCSIPSNLQAYYPFDGNSNDYSGNGRNGIPIGPTFTADRDGNLNWAYYFDGQDIVGLESTTFNLSSELTISAWINSTQTLPFGTIVGRGSVNPFAVQFLNGRISGAVRTSNGISYLNSSSILQQQRWYHVALTYRNGLQSIYINGLEDASKSFNGTLVVPAGQNSSIGASSDGTGNFIGNIEEVKIYNRALTANEVMNLYNLSFVPPQNNPPSVPQNLAGFGISFSTVNLSWNPSFDNETSVAYYKVYRNGLFASQSVPNYYLDTQLTANTSYSYSVSAVDSQGLESNKSNLINVTTLAGSSPTFSNLNAFWKFNEGAGLTTADSSGNNHNGNLVNGATWVVGHNGSAIQFDGANDVVTTDTSDYNITSSFTVALWVKRNNNVNGYGTLISRGNYIYPFNIRLEGPGRVQTAVRTSSGVNYLATNNPIQQGQWYHVALTYANGNRVIYINGVSAVSNIVSGSISVPAGEQFTIGNIPSANLGLNGVVDDVRIYNRALNASEVNALYFS